MALGPRARVTLIAALLFAALGLLVWYLSFGYWTRPVQPLPLPPHGTSEELKPPQLPAPSAPAATPATPAPSPGETPREQSSGAIPPAVASMRLLIPVAGVTREQLRDTYEDSRSEGRTHNAIDIEAPRGTPVLAAADGRVARLFYSEKGGNTIYQLAPDERTVFYYAHLERYADGLAEGHVARRGETIAYVGDTGNAQPGNYHLHFQVYIVTDPKNIWDGTNINPYPLLLDAK